jgi:hypothetical protein
MDSFEIPEGAATAPMYAAYLNAEQAERLHMAAAKARRKYPFARRRIRRVEDAATKRVGEGVPDEVIDVLVESMEGGLKNRTKAEDGRRRT